MKEIPRGTRVRAREKMIVLNSDGPDIEAGEEGEILYPSSSLLEGSCVVRFGEREIVCLVREIEVVERSSFFGSGG